MTINELFTKVTTLRIDLEDAISKAEDKEALFRNILWCIPTGARYVGDKEMRNNIKDLLVAAAENLGIDANKIFNEDGLITDIEKIAGGSKIEIETKPGENEDPVIPTISKWDGSYEEPEQDEAGVYLIKSAANLAWLSETIDVDNTEDNMYRLEIDIDLDNKPWNPIGQTVGIVSADNKGPKDTAVFFKGVFDGNGHKISNLYCEVDDYYAKAGLFAMAHGIIHNLELENVTIKSTHYAGAIVAYNKFGACIVENCKVTNLDIEDNVEFSNNEPDNGDKAGGIMGYAAGNGTMIKDCKVKNAVIKAYRDLGGIVGYVEAPANDAITLENNEVENLKLIQDVTNPYKEFSAVKDHHGSLYGWKGNKTIKITGNTDFEYEYELIEPALDVPGLDPVPDDQES